MAFELQQLRHIVALAQHGTFVRAASALHISQPALSRSIQGLERRLGLVVFQRTGAGVVPTDVGRLFIDRARDLVRMAEELERDAATQGAIRSGVVTVGAGPFVGISVLSRAAVQCIEQYPQVKLRFVVRTWDESLRQLRSRELDFFVAEVSTLQQESDLDVVEMPTPHPFFFVTRPGHPLASRATIKPVDTFEWPFVVPSRIAPRALEPMLAAQRSAVKPQAVSRPFPTLECAELGTIKRIVESSDAVTAMTLTGIENELEDGRLVVLPVEEDWMRLQYGIVTLKERPLTHVAQMFRNFVMAAEASVARDEAELLARWRPGKRARPVTGSAGHRRATAKR